MKLRKVRKIHIHELSIGDISPKTNFSAISQFQADGLADLKDNELKAIPTDMLSATDPTVSPTRTDLQHIRDPQSETLYRDLCDEYVDLFRTTVSSIEANVRPFSLKVDTQC